MAHPFPIGNLLGEGLSKEPKELLLRSLSRRVSGDSLYEQE